MIQRIQTIYLLAAFILLIILYFLPFADFKVEEAFFSLETSGIRDFDVKGYGFELAWFPVIFQWMIPLAAFLIFVSIFYYKNRKLQMTLCKVNMFLLFLLFASIVFYIYQLKIYFEADVRLKIALIIPLIAIVLVGLAHRNIKKDENLVKSYDRIR